MPAPFDKVEDALTFSKGRTKTGRDTQAAKIKDKVARGPVVALWQQTMLRHYPRVPVVAFSDARFGIFKKALALNLRGVDLADFFEWAVTAWQPLRSGKLAWLNRTKELLPVTPSLDVLARYLRVFAKLYADRLTEQSLNEAKQKPTREQELAVKLADAQAQIARQATELTRRRRTRVIRAEIVPREPSRTAVNRDTLTTAGMVYADDEVLEGWKDE
jgi:hypothetical protein